MCGIAGVFYKDHRPAEESEIQAMTRLVHHRGPDGEGFFVEGNLALGHRRLAILDLSLEGKQPMIFRERFVITYNGEVYNYLELRKELAEKGYTFHTGTDTEVILAAYDCWGSNCVHRFNGMWAFCIYDRQNKSLFLCRDRFGIKPMYYIETENSFRFGSEIRQVLPETGQRKANLDVLINYLCAGFEEYDEKTFFHGVFRLLPGHYMICDLNSGKRTVHRYYEIQTDESLQKSDLKEASELYLKTLESSVLLRLRSDVRVGTCLSGGLDSSAIALLAAENFHSPVGEAFTAITACSTQAEKDESRFAKMVAEKARLNWKTTRPEKDDFLRVLQEVIRLQEEPFGSPSIVMQYFVMKKAREAGCVVMLDGQGGDETLLGYERYYPSFLKGLSLVNKWKEFRLATQNSRLTITGLMSYYLYFQFPEIRSARIRNRSSFLKTDLFDLLDKSLWSKPEKGQDELIELQKRELTKTQLPHLLRYEDRNSMAHSIEARLPFIDYRVVETALSLPAKWKIHQGWTKFLLRKGLENRLPGEIVWRKEKIGFEAPEQTWLQHRAEFEKTILESEMLQKICKGNPIASNPDLRLFWRLYNLAKWEQLYHVRID